MTSQHQETGLFGRLWQIVLETSEVAVALRYASPWSR